MKKICFAAALLLLMFCFSVFPASAKEYQENGYEYSLYVIYPRSQSGNFFPSP